MPIYAPARTTAAPVGKGLAVAVLLLSLVEAWLHSDDFLHRFRSVFAAGRAMDKTLYVERHCPGVLVLGNSRADNAFDPLTLAREGGLPIGMSAFNLGLPGADLRVLSGVIDRIEQAGCLRPGGIRHVVLVLDEALVQRVDTLGQEVFFTDRRRMLADGEWLDVLRSTIRLYGFSSNLSQLREPAMLQRFVAAIAHEVEPVGGPAAEHLGYRAGFGGLQAVDSAVRQETGSQAPPNPARVSDLWRLLDRFDAQGIRVAVVYPPLLQRDVLYRVHDRPEAAPYRAIDAELQRRGVPTIVLDDGLPKSSAEFVNAGHLNDRGAQRYSRLLARALSRVWSKPPSALRPSPRGLA